MSNCNITYNGSVISSVDETAPVVVTYDGRTIASVAEGETKTLGCNEKYMNSNVVVGSKTLTCANKIMASDVVVEVEGSAPTIPNYLCLTALGHAVITLRKYGTLTKEQAFETSLDGINWTAYTIGSYITLPEAGDKVYFRGDNITVSEASARYLRFECTVGEGFNCSGNIMSLLDKSCTSTTISNTYCFYRLFYECNKMTTAPELPATTLSSGCYREMFKNCSNLSYIKIGYTGAFGGMPFLTWVTGVAATGDFYYNGTDTTTGISAIPSGWTVHTFS